MKEVLERLMWILISPLLLIGLVYLWGVDIKQKAEWSESWNNYKPNKNDKLEGKTKKKEKHKFVTLIEKAYEDAEKK